MNLPSVRPALRLVAPVLVLAAVTALAGCGSSDDGSGSGSSGGSGGTSGKDAAADGGSVAEPLPLAAYIRGSDEDTKTIQRATELLMTSCMKGYGFDHAPQAGVEEERPARDSEFRMLPADQAASHGYRSPQAAAAAEAPAGNDGKTGSAAEEAVRTGTGAATVAGKAVPDGGCKGEVARTMSKDLPELPEPSPIDEAANTAAQKAMSDSTLVAAVGKWSSCMKEQGFVFAQPQDAIGQFSGKSGQKGAQPGEGDRVSATATAEEKKVAVADSTCNKKASLERTWYTITKPLQQAEIDRRAEEFKLLQDWNKGYVKNAQNALAAG